jgi:uncharacterized membrane protein HdeD (DUF308 family)
MVELLARYWWVVALRGVFAVLFGFLALVWPGITVLALAILFGAYVLVDGVMSAAVGFSDRSSSDRWWYVFLGVLGVLAGLVTLVWPAITVIVLLVAIAIWAIIAGVLQIVAAIRLRKVISNEWFLGLSGLLTLALGVLLIVQPAEGAIALVVAIGIFAIVWGVILLALAFRLRAVGKDLASTPGAP